MPVNPLKEKRKTLDLTLQEAATLSGINYVTLSRLERGKQRLDHYYLCQLANAYNCPLEELTPDDPGLPPLPRGASKNAVTPEPVTAEEPVRA